MHAPTIAPGARVRYRRAVLRALAYGRGSWPWELTGAVEDVKEMAGADYAAVMPDDWDQVTWIAVEDLERI